MAELKLHQVWVASGGHNIPEYVIIRRYYRGLKNLIHFYLPLCHNWIIYDNSNLPPELIATYTPEQKTIIYQPETFKKIQEISHE